MESNRKKNPDGNVRLFYFCICGKLSHLGVGGKRPPFPPTRSIPSSNELRRTLGNRGVLLSHHIPLTPLSLDQRYLPIYHLRTRRIRIKCNQALLYTKLTSPNTHMEPRIPTATPIQGRRHNQAIPHISDQAHFWSRDTTGPIINTVRVVIPPHVIIHSIPIFNFPAHPAQTILAMILTSQWDMSIPMDQHFQKPY
jgi:hypothetical protein